MLNLDEIMLKTINNIAYNRSPIKYIENH